MKCCRPAEWIRYIAIDLGLPSVCRYIASRLTSDIFTKECQHYSTVSRSLVGLSVSSGSPVLVVFLPLLNMSADLLLLPDLTVRTDCEWRLDKKHNQGMKAQHLFISRTYLGMIWVMSGAWLGGASSWACHWHVWGIIWRHVWRHVWGSIRYLRCYMHLWCRFFMLNWFLIFWPQ